MTRQCSLIPKTRLLFSLLVIFSLLPGCKPAPSAQSTEAAKVELGRLLFFDSALSADGRVSCATCHDPDRAFTDGKAVSVGVFGRIGTRNSVSLLALDVYSSHFWDGREAELTAVVLQPFTNPVEMGLPSVSELLRLVEANPRYAAPLATLQGTVRGELDAEILAQSLHAYLGSLRHGASAYDRYLMSADGSDLSTSQIAGLKLFSGKAECGQCHLVDEAVPTFTDNRFHHTGVGFDRISGELPSLLGKLDALSESESPLGHNVLKHADIAAMGRFIKSRSPADLAAFRTPSLRDVALTAPYMHDGSVATLEAAVDREIYYRGLSNGKPIALTAQERSDLIAFLQALTGTTSAEYSEVASKTSAQITVTD